MTQPPLIDFVAGFVAILSADLPAYNINAYRLPADRSKPCIVIDTATAPSDPDLPLIRARVDIRTYAPTGAINPEAEAQEAAASVFSFLHKRRADVTVGPDTLRLYWSKHLNGPQMVNDQETREAYALDMYEGTWAARPV